MVNRVDSRTPAEVFPPGEFISDEITARGWSQVELADILGRPARLISELIAGKRAITPETAMGLGAAFGTGPQFWMNLERDYQLSRAVHDDRAVARKAHLYTKAPVKEMIKRGWIEGSDNVEVLEKRIKGFFHIDTLEEEPQLAHAARKSDYAAITASQWAWVFRVKQLAEECSVSRFSHAALEAAIPKLEALLVAPEESRHVPRILSECGVRFIVVEKLPHGGIDGVCCWIDDAPVIGMSLRRDKIDKFWFVLRHELEHVLRGHGKSSGGVIDVDLEGVRAGTGDDLPEEERVANQAASNFCAPSDKLTNFMKRKHPFYYERDVVAFARLVGRHPGLIVGQMQFRLDNYAYLAKHLARVRHAVVTGCIVDGWGQSPSFCKFI